MQVQGEPFTSNRRHKNPLKQKPNKENNKLEQVGQQANTKAKPLPKLKSFQKAVMVTIAVKKR